MLDLLDVFACKSQFLGRSAIDEPVGFMYNTNQRNNRVHNGRFDAKLVCNRRSTNQSNGNVFCKIPVIYIVRPRNGSQRMTAVSHSIEGVPCFDLFNASEILQRVNLITQRLANGLPLYMPPRSLILPLLVGLKPSVRSESPRRSSWCRNRRSARLRCACWRDALRPCS